MQRTREDGEGVGRWQWQCWVGGWGLEMWVDGSTGAGHCRQACRHLRALS